LGLEVDTVAGGEGRRPFGYHMAKRIQTYRRSVQRVC
jgi:hypothetical protein